MQSLPDALANIPNPEMFAAFVAGLLVIFLGSIAVTIMLFRRYCKRQ
jgi:hypothetical protein